MFRPSIIYPLFFISGASALVFQIVWSRIATLILGRDVIAVGVVLAAFMAGLSFGSYLGGRLSDKSRNPLRLYAFYEIGVGLSALAASAALLHMAPLYLWLHDVVGGSPFTLFTVRFLLVFGVLFIPTTLMGATFPILCRVVVKQLEKVGRELGLLYAINTLGAVAGAVAAGFFFIRLFGQQGTIWVAAAANLAVGLVAWVASKRFAVAQDPGSHSTSPAPGAGDEYGRGLIRPLPAILLCLFALSGLASFAYEIFWTRSLIFILGNTTYAFTLMLTAFLIGISLGGYAVRFVIDGVRQRLLLLALLEILIAVSAASSLPVLFSLFDSQSVQEWLAEMAVGTGSMVLSESLVAMMLMLIPAVLIGATLPVMCRIFVDDLRTTGKAVGKVYAVNTVGNVAGALLPGLLILPLVGIQKGILLMAALNLCIGLACLALGWRRKVAAAAIPVTVFLLLVAAIVRMPLTFQFPSESQTPDDAVLFYEEGGLVTTKVWQEANLGKKFISVDGINIGGTTGADYKQQLLAHLPKLFLTSFRSELSVGLGSGILIGESARHRQLERLACVEISPGVVRGARYFSEENYGVLDDARVEIVIDDIWHYLQTTDESFDIISSDGKTAEKYSTNSFSYSKEYYDQLRKRLNPGGVVIQWVPTALPASQFELVLRTFLDVYPHVALWHFPPVGQFYLPNTILVGSNETIDLDPRRIDRALAENPAAFRGLSKYGLNRAEDILARFVSAEEGLRRNLPPGPVNSFNRPYYEFYSPADYALPWQQRTLENSRFLQSMRGAGWESEARGIKRDLRVGLRRAFEAEGIFLRAYQAQLEEKPHAVVSDLHDRAIERDPGSEVLRNQVVAYLMEQYRFSLQSGDYDRALRMARRAVAVYPGNAEVHENLGMILMLNRRLNKAVEEFNRALELDDDLVFPLRALGLIYSAWGEDRKAEAFWRDALSVSPTDVMTRVFLGTHLAEQGLAEEGEKHLRRAYQLAPRNPAVINGYAQVLLLAGKSGAARDVVLEGGRYYEGSPVFRRLRSEVLSATD